MLKMSNETSQKCEVDPSRQQTRQCGTSEMGLSDLSIDGGLGQPLWAHFATDCAVDGGLGGV